MWLLCICVDEFFCVWQYVSFCRWRNFWAHYNPLWSTDGAKLFQTSVWSKSEVKLLLLYNASGEAGLNSFELVERNKQTLWIEKLLNKLVDLFNIMPSSTDRLWTYQSPESYWIFWLFINQTNKFFWSILLYSFFFFNLFCAQQLFNFQEYSGVFWISCEVF